MALLMLVVLLGSSSDERPISTDGPPRENIEKSLPVDARLTGHHFPV